MHLVKPIPKPEGRKLRSKAAAKPADMVQCPRCGGREVMETVIGASLVGGKLKGGTRQVVCVGCMLKGERVVLA